jgi:hypothetical protein
LGTSIRVYLPSHCAIEAQYCFDVIWSCISNIEAEYFVSDNNDYALEVVGSDRKLIVKNHFFIQNIEEWYSKDRIPNFAKAGTIHAQEVIAIYGKPHYDRTNHILDLDVAGSAFFMLSRWEEVVDLSRDEHGRYNENNALAVRSQFIDRPIIHEYALLLCKLLDLSRENKLGVVNLSFDIDYVYKWKSLRSLLGSLRSLSASMKDKMGYIASFLLTKLINRKHDTFFSFDFILQRLKAQSLASTFYFKTGVTHASYDENDYQIEDKIINSTLKQILDQGHSIGLHPSYNAMLDSKIMEEEKDRLQNALGYSVSLVRQHFLRSVVPDTLYMQESLGFTEDSSLMYSRHFGFRNGVARPFKFFDFKTRRTLEIMVKPLIAMTTIGVDLPLSDQLSTFKKLIHKVQAVGGNAYILIHNSDLDTKAKKAFFEEILSEI